MVNNFRLGLVDDTLRFGDYHVPDFSSIPETVCVDVGTNVGTFILTNHSRFTHIFGFEASYENFQKCNDNLKLRGIQNTVLFNLAAASKTGELVNIQTHLSKDHGSCSIIKHEHWHSEKSHPILSISFENVFKLIGTDHVHYMKLDIEGGEYDFLMNKDLSKIDYIGIEMHGQIGEKRKELQEYLERYFVVITDYNQNCPFDENYEVSLMNRRLL
jgi:FkbM family methyltransferase